MTALENESSAIARGLRQRDPDLLDRLIEQHQHRLLRYLIHLTGNQELAKDVFQETWIRVMERGNQFDGRGEFRTWLFTVARNLAYDQLRRRRAVSLESLADEDGDNFHEPIDNRPPAWEILARHELIDHLSAALGRIPAEYRETVVLRFQESLSLEEISSVMKTPLGTVKSRLYRALNLLMAQMKGIRE